jgi:hypothetical protein
VSLYFLKFIEYKKPSGSGASETLFFSLNMIQAERIIFQGIELMIDQGPLKNVSSQALKKIPPRRSCSPKYYIEVL